jgi:hypothetical protein
VLNTEIHCAVSLVALSKIQGEDTVVFERCKTHCDQISCFQNDRERLEEQDNAGP